MAGAGGVVFHVEFGINETHLTILLESSEYSAAEQHIKENEDESYLNEGK